MTDAAAVWNLAGAILVSILAGAGLLVPLAKFFGERLAERWLAGVRAQHDAELERLRADLALAARGDQARLDHAVFVSRSQFETEYGAYKEIWRLVAEAGVSLRGIRPNMSIAPVEQTREEKVENLFRLLRALGGAHDKALEVLVSHEPFIEPEIHDHFDAAIGILRREINDVRTDDKPFSGDWFKEGGMNRDTFEAKMAAARDKIRLRIASLRIKES